MSSSLRVVFLASVLGCAGLLPVAPFVAGPVAPREIPEAAVRLEAPENLVTRSASATGVTLGADGLDGTITVVVAPSPVAAGSGASTTCTGGSCVRTTTAGCRKLTCTSSAGPMGEAVCASVASTYEPPVEASTRYYGNMGGTVNCVEDPTPAFEGLAAVAEAQLPGVAACVKQHPPTPAAGKELRVELEVRSVLDQAELVFAAKLEGAAADSPELLACVEPLLAPLKAKLPTVKQPCGLQQRYLFEIALEPKCPPT